MQRRGLAITIHVRKDAAALLSQLSIPMDTCSCTDVPPKLHRVHRALVAAQPFFWILFSVACGLQYQRVLSHGTQGHSNVSASVSIEYCRCLPLHFLLHCFHSFFFFAVTRAAARTFLATRNTWVTCKTSLQAFSLISCNNSFVGNFSAVSSWRRRKGKIIIGCCCGSGSPRLARHTRLGRTQTHTRTTQDDVTNAPSPSPALTHAPAMKVQVKKKS